MDESSFDVPSCLERLRRPGGDEEAACQLMRHLYPLVRKLVRSHLPRRTPEEDLCQTVFIKIFQNLHQYSGQAPIEHWVSRIAVNTCLNQLQAEKIRPEVRLADLSEEEAFVVETLASTAAELPHSHEIASREMLEYLMARLEPPDRLVINLVHLEGRSVAEVAQMTGWSRPVVKIRAFRARQKLKGHLATLLRKEEPTCARSIISCIAS